MKEKCYVLEEYKIEFRLVYGVMDSFFEEAILK